MRMRLLPVFLAVFCASCAAATQYVAPDPRHAQDSIESEAAGILDGVQATLKDFQESLQGAGNQGKGRIFVHVHENNLNTNVVDALDFGIARLLEDAGYEVVPRDEILGSLAGRNMADIPFPQQAAMVLSSFDGAGALEILVTSRSVAGRGELNLEGKYRERVTVKARATAYQARFGDVVFDERLALESASEYRQAERYYYERIRRLNTSEQAVYEMLLDAVTALTPRIPVGCGSSSSTAARVSASDMTRPT